MRIRLMISDWGALLASANLARAQQAALDPGGPGRRRRRATVDFGARVTSTTGDEARYERYRDLRSGLASTISFRQDHRSSHVERRRPRTSATAIRGTRAATRTARRRSPACSTRSR